MSYYCGILDENFVIKKDKKGLAYKALYDWAVTTGWINTNDIDRALTLETLMEELGFPVEDYEKTGGIDEISIAGKWRGNEKDIFDVLAPFVEDGSYVGFIGEDNGMWRYVFENGKCIEQFGSVKWVDL